MGHHLTTISDQERVQLVSSADAMFDFVTVQFPVLFELADPIEAELQKLG